MAGRSYLMDKIRRAQSNISDVLLVSVAWRRVAEQVPGRKRCCFPRRRET